MVISVKVLILLRQGQNAWFGVISNMRGGAVDG
jgi:hypothetical protein